MATVVVVGGGISGLSFAYYLQRNAAKIGKIILLEGAKRTGGWMQSVQHDDGAIFEYGPRSLRPAGKAGKNTLRLVEELGLTKDILVVHRSDAAAKKRYLYVGGQLCALPSSFGEAVRTRPPFSRPLLMSFLGEPFATRNKAPDETIHGFIGRRLGREFADVAVDAMCRGIFANDCRKLSMRSCFPDIFDLERQHGSLTMGMFRSRGAKLENETELEKRSKSERWASWSLKYGIQQLSDAVEEAAATSSLCEVRKDSPCLGLMLTPERKMKVKTPGEEILADHVVSAVYSKDLASLLPPDFSPLQTLLRSVPSASVYVVNLEYPGHQLPVEGFGHLLPSSESPHVLGIVYDSCTFPGHDRLDKPSTRLTVMLGGGWLDAMLTESGDLPDDDAVAAMAKQAACQQLRISPELQPSKVNVVYQKECIPAYLLGHADRLSQIDDFIQKSGLPLRLVGSSYKGVSVNDCINNARIEAESLLGQL